MQPRADIHPAIRRAAQRIRGDAVPPVHVALPPLYPAQQAFVAAPQHYTGWMAGIAAGKSYAGAVRAVQAAYGHVGEATIPTPNLGMATAPTYTMLRDATLRTFREVAGDKVKDYRKSEHTAVMTNGSEVIFRSADDPEHLRGPNLSWWWGDEAALYTGDAWKIMIGRLRQHGHGYAWLTTTPKGHNWIYQEFVSRHADDADYVLLKARTRDNPYLDTHYIEGLEASYTGDFARQELDADFVAFEGLVYPEFSRDSHTAQDIPQRFVRVIAGVDWGFTNPGVIQVFGLTADDVMIHVHEEYQRQRGIDEWARIARQLRDLWQIEAFYCDPSEPDYIRKFQEAGCKAIGANNTVSTGIQAVKRRLTAKRLLHYRGAVNTFAEYESYQWARRGDTMLDQPQKANDHALDSLRYVVLAVDPPLKPLIATVRQYA